MTKLSKAQVKALKRLSRTDVVEAGTQELRSSTARILREKGLIEVAHSEKPRYDSYQSVLTGEWRSKLVPGYTTFRITEEGRFELARRGDDQSDWFEGAIADAKRLEASWAPRNENEAALWAEKARELEQLRDKVKAHS